MTQDDYVVMKRSSKEKLIKELKKVKKENQQLKKQKDELQKEMDYVDEYNKHLLKQKDDVVEYIKKRTIFGEYTIAYPGILNQDEVRKILRMLGEIDETDNLQ